MKKVEKKEITNVHSRRSQIQEEDEPSTPKSPLNAFVEKIMFKNLKDWKEKTSERKEYISNVSPFICEDVIFCITSFLDFSEICNVLPTCKVWHEHGLKSVKKILLLFTSKKLRIFLKIWKEFFEKYIINKCTRLQTLVVITNQFSMCYFDNWFLEKVTEKKNLSCIQLVGCDMLTPNNGLRKMITNYTMKTRMRLKYLRLENMKLIGENDSVIKSLGLLNLDKLKLIRVPTLNTVPSNVKYLVVDSSYWVSKIKENEKFFFEKLKIYGSYILEEKSKVSLKMKNFPNLKILYLQNFGTFPLEIPQNLDFLKLKNFSLGDNFYRSFEGLKKILSTNKIKKVRISDFFKRNAKKTQLIDFWVSSEILKLFETNVFLESLLLWDFSDEYISRNMLNFDSMRAKFEVRLKTQTAIFKEPSKTEQKQPLERGRNRNVRGRIGRGRLLRPLFERKYFGDTYDEDAFLPQFNRNNPLDWNYFMNILMDVKGKKREEVPEEDVFEVYDDIDDVLDGHDISKLSEEEDFKDLESNM